MESNNFIRRESFKENEFAEEMIIYEYWNSK